MKISRSFLIWTALAICGIIVVGAMAWLTRGVLASEENRVKAEARADLEESTRLALWRMDAVGAAILLRENQRPPTEFQTVGLDPFETASLVNLRFELRNGRLFSPPAADSATKLQSLRGLLSKNGDMASLLSRAAAASEEAWQAMPKDAAELKTRVAPSKSSPAFKRRDSSYQTDSNRIEKIERSKVVESQEATAAVINQNLTKSTSSPAAEVAGDSSASFGEIMEISSMRPVWIDAELLLIRDVTLRASGGDRKVIQGVWLNAAKLREHLLKQTTDLLSGADLERLAIRMDDPLALASFPFRLLRSPVELPPSPPVSKPLLVGWIAVGVAILTVSLLVHGVMLLSERRASFVSAVTHELRTPLTTFRLYSDMLESGAVKEEKRGDYLRVLSREADRLSHLVENVLSFSKIERGSARSQIAESGVGDLLESMRERLEARLATAGMSLEIENMENFRVRVDSAAVEHILFNLIDNAAKYAAGSEPPWVVIRLKATPRMIEISVSDHGPGIPASEHRRIFRAFHKSAREAAESRPGVGLGLALSRRLAKSLGGALECGVSKSGACFVLRLPRAL